MAKHAFMAEDSREILECYPPMKLQEFGLGRGVNGTDPQPWVNKLSIQIRDIVRKDQDTSPESHGKTYETNLIATNEGGVDHSFVQEVTRIKDQKLKLSSSITVPNSPVTVGVGADVSRSLSTTRKAVGKRIINRTVSFTANHSAEAERNLVKLIIDSADSIEIDWTKIDSTKSDLIKMNDYIQAMKELSKSEVETLFKEFVERYRVTHYVSSISLGASKFTVQSDSTESKEASGSGDIGVQQVAQATVSASYLKKKLKKKESVQRIGILSEDLEEKEGEKKEKAPDPEVTKEEVVDGKMKSKKKKVPLKVIKEAVVDVRMEPISSLFQRKKFRLAMQNALENFFHKHDFGKEGPYRISCNDDDIYLKVVLDDNDKASVYGTKNIKNASNFHITLTDECSSRGYEFYIGWQKPDKPGNADKPGTIRYLHAPLSMTGRHSGPLTMERRGKKRYSIFAINSRLIDTFIGIRLRSRSSANLNPEEWFKGLESCLISCHGHTAGRGGFLAIQRSSGASLQEYRTICTGLDNRSAHMTFQLHSTKSSSSLDLTKDGQQSAASKSDTNQETSPETVTDMSDT